MKIKKTQIIERKIDMIERDMQKQIAVMAHQTFQVARARGVSKAVFLMLPAIAFLAGWRRSFGVVKQTSKFFAFVFSTWARKQFAALGYNLFNLASHGLIKKIKKQ